MDDAFQFLVDQHGFARERGDAGFSYHCPTLTVEPSFNERDGFETHLFFPEQGSERVAVGTILSALDMPGPHDIPAQTSFIKSNLDKLANPSVEAFRDLAALRFWHAPDWRRSWGTTIRLSSASISDEKARLLRLRQYFARVA
jgi:hypothetical protein